MLRQRLPLFNGQVPLNGDLAANAAREIEAILKEKGVAASISVLPAGSLNGPINSMAFSATTPRVEIAEIQFTGASRSQIEALRKATAPLVGTEYRQTMLQDFASNNIRPIYLNQGYLHVVLEKGQATPISTSPELAKVRITVPIEEGSVYRLAALNWPGSDILPAAAAPKLYLLKPGDVLNQDLLKKSLSNVGSAYFAKGFLKATIKANPTFDEAAQTITYDIAVVPGELYHLRNVEFKNLSDAQLQKVKEVWKLRAGDVYDPTYPPNFLVSNRNSLRFLDGWSAIWTQKIYDDEKAVDVVMTFRPGGPLK
jgi:outer membrane translocation and assembly module TamA